MKTCVAWFTVAGCILGVLGATFVYTVERPVFAGAAIFRPLRAADDQPGVSHREWLKTEAAALGAEANLMKVVRNLNLESAWSMSAGESVTEVRERMQVSIPDETTLIQVIVTGTKRAECAALANGVVKAREETVREAAWSRQSNLQSTYSARVKTLTKSSGDKHAELVVAMKSAGVTGDFSDASLLAATLTPELSAMRDAWQADAAQLAYTKEKLAEASLPQIISPYAETLQKAAPQVNSVGPSWYPRATWWAAIGAGFGLVVGVLVGALRRRMPPRSAIGTASPLPLGAVEF